MSNVQETMTVEEVEALKALRCLYLELPMEIAGDVHNRVTAAFTAIKAAEQKRCVEIVENICGEQVPNPQAQAYRSMIGQRIVERIKAG